MKTLNINSYFTADFDCPLNKFKRAAINEFDNALLWWDLYNRLRGPWWSEISESGSLIVEQFPNI